MHASLSKQLTPSSAHLNGCQDTLVLHNNLLATVLASPRPMQGLWLCRGGLQGMRRMKAQPVRMQLPGEALHALCD